MNLSISEAPEHYITFILSECLSFVKLVSVFPCGSVLYFSVHRYEDGSFWPHLKESDSSSVGSGAGQGYNINLPWNKVHHANLFCLSVFKRLTNLYLHTEVPKTSV